jgi:hypothetical protein
MMLLCGAADQFHSPVIVMVMMMMMMTLVLLQLRWCCG